MEQPAPVQPQAQLSSSKTTGLINLQCKAETIFVPLTGLSEPPQLMYCKARLAADFAPQKMTRKLHRRIEAKQIFWQAVNKTAHSFDDSIHTFLLRPANQCLS